jgi:hypothetical protein
MMIWGVHVHVAVEDRRKVLPIIDGLLTYLPHFQALSASSPFWSGEVTGYASNRALMFQQLPTAGLPPQFAEWEQYEGMVADLLHTGVIDELGELRWDIRPSPRWGTIEVRTFDGISTSREISAIAALTQCLVEHFSRELEAGRQLPTLQPWFVHENKWRAARYGMDDHHPERRRRRAAGHRGPRRAAAGAGTGRAGTGLHRGAGERPGHRHPRRQLPAPTAGRRRERRQPEGRGVLARPRTARRARRVIAPISRSEFDPSCVRRIGS